MSVVVSFVMATLPEPFQNFASAAAQVNVPVVSCTPEVPVSLSQVPSAADAEEMASRELP